MKYWLSMIVERDITQSSKSVSIHKDFFTHVNVLFGRSKTAGNKGDIYLKL